MIVPSVFEPFSLAALESMGAGVPVITSRVVGVSEIMIQGVHGEILPDTSNIDAISEAIRRWLMLLEDPDKRASVCESCVALASQYTLERNLVETLSVIRELVEEKRGQVDR
jgi:glycosyltransferase involved in cell wall biosynthesis